jgi:hypothetical protein
MTNGQEKDEHYPNAILTAPVKHPPLKQYLTRAFLRATLSYKLNYKIET